MAGPIHGRCYFVDVGQGTANVVLLSGGRALLLDAGPIRTNSPVHKLLNQFANTIECVVLSHHDRDHIAGWERIATDFEYNIGAVWCLPDAMLEARLRVDVTMQLARDGKIPIPGWASVDALGNPKTIWRDEKLGMRLDLVYPDQLGNIDAQLAKNPNRSSVIAVLYQNDRAILFPGDSEIDAWKRLKDNSTLLPIKVDAVAMPHHGALMDASPEELDWLFADGIRPLRAVFSVGTNNTHRHPRPEVLAVLRRHGTQIACTQITPQCHPAKSLEALRPGVAVSLVQFSAASRMRSTTSSAKKSRNVGCSGTIVANLHEGDITVEKRQELLTAINAKVETPMCLEKL